MDAILAARQATEPRIGASNVGASNVDASNVDASNLERSAGWRICVCEGSLECNRTLWHES
jgi:hypothetical protein